MDWRGWRGWALASLVVGAVLAAVLLLGDVLGSDDDACSKFNAQGCAEEGPASEAERKAATPTEINIEVPAEFSEGRLVAAQSGCLACHRFGSDGNRGPGPNLTHVGARLSESEITRALLNPRGIMPPYAELPDQELDALVAFLAALD